MGWTILYIAFGIVALWLLGEVLLQYKARLRWRLLAFAGFCGVVVGVLISSVVVIGIGAAAFAVGQTYVTLSFRRGFAAGWALNVGPGRREDAEPDDYGDYDDHDQPPPQAPDAAARRAPEQHGGAPERDEVYRPQPLPDDTGSYGVYSEAGYGTGQGGSSSAYGDYNQDAMAGQGSGGYTGQYDYGTGQYDAYADPYIGAGATQNYGSYDQYGTYNGQYDTGQYGGQYGDGQYGEGQYGAGQYGDPYGGGGQSYPDPSYPDGSYAQTPPGDVWVPQQREGEAPPQPAAPPMPEEQPYPYQQGNWHSGDYGDQYRY